jgi:hypothetical protein
MFPWSSSFGHAFSFILGFYRDLIRMNFMKVETSPYNLSLSFSRP